MRWLLVFASVCLLAVPAADAATHEEVPAGAIALVGGQAVPRSEFDSLLEQARRGFAREKRTFPRVGSPEYEALKRQAVEYLVVRVVFRQQGAAQGIAITPEQVAARRADLIRDYFAGSLTKYRQEIGKLGLTDAEVRAELEFQLLQEALYERVTGALGVPETDVEAYYREHLDQFVRPPSRQVRHILVRTRARAVSLRARIVHGASFAQLARRYSTDAGSRRQGGKLTVEQGRTVKTFDRVAFALKQGQLSQPVHTRFGWHLIQALTAVRPRETIALELASGYIRQSLLVERRSEAFARWQQEVRAATPVVYAPGFEP